MKVLQISALATLGITSIFAQIPVDYDSIGIIVNHQAPAAAIKYLPKLYIETGCIPYPAVDQAGHVSRGQDQIGASPADGCNRKGQVYSRVGVVGSKIGIMYAWYFSSERSQGTPNHKSVWQAAVVFVNSMGEAVPNTIAFTSKGTWKRSNHYFREGAHAVIGKRYEELYTDTVVASDIGTDVELVDWSALSPAAQRALNVYSFGPSPNQICPINNPNFLKYLQAAYDVAH